jgi:hypothetical protein
MSKKRSLVTRGKYVLSTVVGVIETSTVESMGIDRVCLKRRKRMEMYMLVTRGKYVLSTVVGVID